MRALALLILLLCPGLAMAQSGPMPALYDVVRVAADDVLNVRERPDAGASIVATLAPGQRGVEVVEVSESGGWGRIITGEGSGWAALAYLDRQADQDGFPPVHSCTGTEPFWGLWQELDGWFYSSPDGPDHALAEGWRGTASGRLDRFGLSMRHEAMTATAVIRRELCSDGMSDRVYGLSVDVILSGQAGDAPRLMSGCCQLAAN